MVNKKLIALLVAISTISAISAEYGECYRDADGYRHCKGVVSAPVQESGNVVKRSSPIIKAWALDSLLLIIFFSSKSNLCSKHRFFQTFSNFKFLVMEITFYYIAIIFPP